MCASFFLSGKFLDIECNAAAQLTQRILDGVEEANGIDSGAMERKLELQDVFLLKASLLSRLRMQREDAAYAQLMSKCQSVLSRTKELGCLMEQVFFVSHYILTFSIVNYLVIPACLNRPLTLPPGRLHRY